MSYEFSNCIKDDDGTIYCWDCVLKHYVMLNPQIVSPSKIPAHILEGLMIKSEEKNSKESLYGKA